MYAHRSKLLLTSYAWQHLSSIIFTNMQTNTCTNTQVRAAPDELRVAAPELSRALLYCRVPDWAEVEAQRCVCKLLCAV